MGTVSFVEEALGEIGVALSPKTPAGKRQRDDEWVDTASTAAGGSAETVVGEQQFAWRAGAATEIGQKPTNEDRCAARLQQESGFDICTHHGLNARLKHEMLCWWVLLPRQRCHRHDATCPHIDQIFVRPPPSPPPFFRFILDAPCGSLGSLFAVLDGASKRGGGGAPSSLLQENKLSVVVAVGAGWPRSSLSGDLFNTAIPLC